MQITLPPPPPFTVVEAYKNIRFQLTTALDKIGGKTVAISSSNASEGKSTTSVNIAITLSQLKKKVIIVDTDIRRGTIHQKFKLENGAGCCEILSGSAKLEECIITHSPYLDIITHGKNLSESSEIFDSSLFEEFLEALKAKYDYVILDTPPINIVSDTLVISKKCDGLLLIIRSSFTTYNDFKKSLDITKELNINLLGVVLNAVKSETAAYHKYGINKKYGYDYYKSNRYGD